jgi:hypothetical protein
MNGFVDPNGLSQTSGIQAALRTLGKGFALEVVRCHNRYIAGDHERLDAAGRSYYSTRAGTIVFMLPTGPPWFAHVQLLQEG